uniref:Putative glycosyltransferase n=1 Tax=viral metagenome TaxID=1070528 RepID=A0A6M3M6H7_9ZZZZ
MNKLSYCLIGDLKGANVVDPNNDKVQLSGLYLWSRAFNLFGKKGTIEPFWRKEDLEDYDIIHVNYTPSNNQLPTIIKDELGSSSSTKLVLNVDIDIKYWGSNWAYYLTNFIRDMKKADVLFHVEPRGAELIEHLIGKTVHTNPHPVDSTNIYDDMREEREPIIGTIFHRYFPNTIIPYTAQKNIPLRRVLFGHQPVGKHGVVANAGMFDQILGYQPFNEYIVELSKCAIGCDLYEGFSYGRATVEFASLGIPAVVSNTIAASNIFPQTSVHPYDVKGAESMFKKLIEDNEFCNEVIMEAHEGCKMYSLENSYKRFVEMME